MVIQDNLITARIKVLTIAYFSMLGNKHLNNVNLFSQVDYKYLMFVIRGSNLNHLLSVVFSKSLSSVVVEQLLVG